MKIRFAILAGLLAFSAMAQHEHAIAPGTAPLIPNLGQLHHPISTSNPEAQRYFDQGLTLIYAFNHEEAGRSFGRATELDPHCAMCFWGVALAVGPNYNDPEIDEHRRKAAVEAIHKAMELSRAGLENEKAYVSALAKRYSEDPKADTKKLSLDYKQAMGEVAKRYPGDLDAATLYAESAMDLRPWQLWTADGQPAEGTLDIVKTLQSVLQRAPDHIGANHYFIHATEASPHPEEAMSSAKRLATLAPAAGHLVHMPAHTYIRTGDYHAASVANADAATADRAYVEKYHVNSMYSVMYFSHNIHFLAISCAMEGRFADADAAAKQLEKRVAPFIGKIPMAEWFVPTRTFILVRFRRWDEIEKLPEPDRKLRLAHAFWQFGRGMAATGAGQATRGEAASAALKRELDAIPSDLKMGFNNARDIAGIASLQLEASTARAKGNDAAAIDLLRKAVEAEDKLNYDEPPDWYLPSRESLGALLLKQERFEEAGAVFRQDLKMHLRNPRSLFGLAECLKAAGKEEEVKHVRSDFEAGWKFADTRLQINDL